jgi:anti-sigma factor ChrR (cupin superfamily)
VESFERGFHVLEPDAHDWIDAGRGSAMAEGVKVKWLVRPEEGRLAVELIQFAPNFEWPKHSHTAPELTIFLSGSAWFNGQLCTPGTMAFVDEGVFYGPEKAGPDGCEFLIIRPRAATMNFDESES